MDNVEDVMTDNNGWELKGVGQARVRKTGKSTGGKKVKVSVEGQQGLCSKVWVETNEGL